MAIDFSTIDFNSLKPTLGAFDYPHKYDTFVDHMAGFAEELQLAREGFDDLVTNLQTTYAKYILDENIEGGLDPITPTPTYKCVNMANGVLPQDYVTVVQLDGLQGLADAEITSLLPGLSLNANDTLAIHHDPTTPAIIGRPNAMGAIIGSGPVTAAFNSNNAFDLSGGSFTINLPTVTIGANSFDGVPIRFNDVNGTVDQEGTKVLTISPGGGQKIMGYAEDLEVAEYPYISFTLIWVEAATSWYITNLQR